MLRLEYSLDDIKRLEREIGFDEGREEGFGQGKLEIAREMLKFGIKINDISLMTGLEIDIIRELI